MRGAVTYAPGDVRVEERPDPAITAPTDAIIRLAATCVCGSDLWSWRGTDPVTQPTPMGHEYAGIVEEVGAGGAQAELLRVPLADGTLVATSGMPPASMVPDLLAASDVLGTAWFGAVAASAGSCPTSSISLRTGPSAQAGSSTSSFRWPRPPRDTRPWTGAAPSRPCPGPKTRVPAS
jgi:threonine dehydrogenase-like Zn-dependent dehydrogenase